jgi:hypothetical protein
MEPIYKYNNGNGAMLCVKCRTIISTGPKTEELYCEKCKPKQETLLGKTISKKDADKDSFEDVINYKIKRSYSEEDLIQTLIKFNQEIQEVEDVREWFEKFKKK